MSDQKSYIGKESIEKLRELVEDIGIGMLCTRLDEFPFSARPMAAQQVDDEGNIWFLSNRTGEHNADINRDNRVQLLFSHPGDSSYLSISGYAEILEDRQKVEEIWTPIAKTWFTEGKDDPIISLIKVKATEGYYWDTKHNKMVALMKVAAGMVLGKTMDDSIEGRLKVSTR